MIKLEEKADCLISSLVLIHNVHENDYNELVEIYCKLAKTIYVFEDISESNRVVSPYTRIRDIGTVKRSFCEFGYSIIDPKKDELIYTLGEDKIAFLRFNNRYS